MIPLSPRDSYEEQLYHRKIHCRNFENIFRKGLFLTLKQFLLQIRRRICIIWVEGFLGFGLGCLKAINNRRNSLGRVWYWRMVARCLGADLMLGDQG